VLAAAEGAWLATVLVLFNEMVLFRLLADTLPLGPRHRPPISLVLSPRFIYYFFAPLYFFPDYLESFFIYLSFCRFISFYVSLNYCSLLLILVDFFLLTKFFFCFFLVRLEIFSLSLSFCGSNLFFCFSVYSPLSCFASQFSFRNIFYVGLPVSLFHVDSSFCFVYFYSTVWITGLPTHTLALFFSPLFPLRLPVLFVLHKTEANNMRISEIQPTTFQENSKKT
jgi:hypothetical protein